MRKDDCYELGKVLRTHGLQGNLSVFFDVDSPENYQGLDAIFVEIETQLVPFLVQNLHLKPNAVLLKLQEIDTIEQAKELVGCRLFLPLEVLPELTRDNEYYLHELVGCQIQDKTHGELGTVQKIYDLGGQDLFAFDYQNKEILVPINDQIISNFNRSKKQIQTDLPAGLLEVYLENS